MSARPAGTVRDVSRLDEPTRARVSATTDADLALRAAFGMQAFTTSIRTELVVRGGSWTGETRTVVRYPRASAWIGRDASSVLAKLPDAEVAHTPGRIAVVRASERVRCGCHGINSHRRDRNAGCPPDWDAVRLLPKRDYVRGGPWCDHRAPKPLGWECVDCGAFSRDIPLKAGWDRVVADYADHRANRCPGPLPPAKHWGGSPA